MKAVEPSSDPVPVGIALGSNQGDRLANLKEARARITMLTPGNHPPAAPCLSAPVFETEPLDCSPEAGPFLNTVIEIGCPAPFSPTRLLRRLQGIENALGRPTHHPRNAPRPIDLDILYAGRFRSDRPGLTLPHPRLAQRRFVLEPLAGIRPDLVLPGETRSVAELLRAFGPEQKVTLYASCW